MTLTNCPKALLDEATVEFLRESVANGAGISRSCLTEAILQGKQGQPLSS